MSCCTQAVSDRVVTLNLPAVRRLSERRVAGWLDSVIAAGTSDGITLKLRESEWVELYRHGRKFPFWASAIALLANNRDLGVGDTIARVIGPVGGEAFKRWYHKMTGRTCGCAMRQHRLNSLYPYL